MGYMSCDISISFVIPVLNGEKYIAGCLDHIMKEMEPQDEIIVVDNGSHDRTVSIVSSYSDVLLLEYPKGTIAALRNLGASRARNSILAFIDCDCLVCPGWRSSVRIVFEDQSVAATGSDCALPESTTWVERAWLSARPTSRMAVDYIGSANFVVRLRHFQAIGGFDESLVTDEDTNIGFRLRREGLLIINEPAVKVIHLGNAKTICQFYRRQKWHAIGGLTLTIDGRIDRPMIMHLMFILSWLSALLLLLLTDCQPAMVLLIASLIAWVPATASLYRCIRYNHFRYLAPLALLYAVFFLSRTDAGLSLSFESCLNMLLPKRNKSEEGLI